MIHDLSDLPNIILIIFTLYIKIFSPSGNILATQYKAAKSELLKNILSSLITPAIK